MYKTEVAMYSDQSHSAIIRYPGRHFPGVLIQGDALRILQADLKEALEKLCGGNIESAMEILLAIDEHLREHLENYRDTLKAHCHGRIVGEVYMPPGQNLKSRLLNSGKKTYEYVKLAQDHSLFSKSK